MSLVILTHYSPSLKNTLPCGRRTSISHSLWSLGRKMKLVSELHWTVPPAHARLWVIHYWLKLFIGSVIKSTVVWTFEHQMHPSQSINYEHSSYSVVRKRWFPDVSSANPDTGHRHGAERDHKGQLTRTKSPLEWWHTGFGNSRLL